MWKAFGIALLLLMSGATCFAQSSYKGLTPGRSTRADVERVLGRPVKSVSATLVEYRPQPMTSKIFVQYRGGAPVVERIEVLCRLENSTCNDFTKSLNLRLPEPESAKVPELGGGKYTVFYYGAPVYAAATIDAAGFENDPVVPFRIAFYSPELYQAAKESNETAIAQAVEDQKKPPVPQPGQITGIVILNGNPVAGATIDLYRTDGLSGRFQGKTDRHGVFILYGVFSGSYVAVASGPGMKWTYVKGLNIPVANALEIVAESGDGARPTQEQVMATLR